MEDEDNPFLDIDLELIKTEISSDDEYSDEDSASDKESHDSGDVFKPYNPIKNQNKKIVQGSKGQQGGGGAVKRGRGRPRKVQIADSGIQRRRGRGRPPGSRSKDQKAKLIARTRITRSKFGFKNKTVGQINKKLVAPASRKEMENGDTTPRRGRGRPKKNSFDADDSVASPPSVKSTPKQSMSTSSGKTGSPSKTSTLPTRISPSKRDRRIPKRYLSESEEEDDDSKRHSSKSAQRNGPSTSSNKTSRAAAGSPMTGRQFQRQRGRGRPPKNIENSRGQRSPSPSTTARQAMKVYDFETSSDEEKDQNGDESRNFTPKRNSVLKNKKKARFSSPATPATPLVNPVKRGRGRPRSVNVTPNSGMKRKINPNERSGPAAKKVKLSVSTTLEDSNSDMEEEESPEKVEGSDDEEEDIPNKTVKSPLLPRKNKDEEIMRSGTRGGRPRLRPEPLLNNNSNRKAKLMSSSSRTSSPLATTPTPGSAHLPLKKRGRPRKNVIKPDEDEGEEVVEDLGSRTVEKQVSCGLEVCVDNIQSIVNAVEGGASRIELCSALSEGGLTPTVGLLKVGKQVAKNIPIFVMIRPRCGNFIYSEQEMKIMEMDIHSLKAAGADGFVFGILNESGDVDVEKCGRLLKSALPLPSTFHRAFDLISGDGMDTNKTIESLEKVVALGFERILTSGLQPTALKGVPLLKQMVIAANKRISIMAGCGVTPGNVEEIVKETGVTEVHGSLRIKIRGGERTGSSSQVTMGTAGEDDSAHFVSSASLVKETVSNLNAALKELEKQKEAKDVEDGGNSAVENGMPDEDMNISETNNDCDESVETETEKTPGPAINDTQPLIVPDNDTSPAVAIVQDTEPTDPSTNSKSLSDGEIGTCDDEETAGKGAHHNQTTTPDAPPIETIAIDSSDGNEGEPIPPENGGSEASKEPLSTSSTDLGLRNSNGVDSVTNGGPFETTMMDTDTEMYASIVVNENSEESSVGYSNVDPVSATETNKLASAEVESSGNFENSASVEEAQRVDRAGQPSERPPRVEVLGIEEIDDLLSYSFSSQYHRMN